MLRCLVGSEMFIIDRAEGEDHPRRDGGGGDLRLRPAALLEIGVHHAEPGNPDPLRALRADQRQVEVGGLMVGVVLEIQRLIVVIVRAPSAAENGCAVAWPPSRPRTAAVTIVT